MGRISGVSEMQRSYRSTTICGQSAGARSSRICAIKEGCEGEREL